MARRNADDCIVPDEVIQRLYEIRKSLIWKSFRLPDEMYDVVWCREGMALDMSFLADDVEFIMADLGVDLSSDYFNELELPEGAETTPLSKRWRDFWVTRAKKTSGMG